MHECLNCGERFETHYEWRWHGCEAPGPWRTANRLLADQRRAAAAFNAPFVTLCAQLEAAMRPFAAAAAGLNAGVGESIARFSASTAGLDRALEEARAAVVVLARLLGGGRP